MSKAPVGATVRLYVDLQAVVWVGDIIETGTGRQYFVTEARRQTRGKHTGRQHLHAVVIDREAVCPSAMVGRIVHRISWYRRDRRGAAA